MITTVVSDFGGVLTTPLADAFAHVQQQFGIAPELLGRAMAVVQDRTGRHPLHELECGRVTEREFMASLGDAAGVELHSFTEHYFAALHPNEPFLAHVADLKARGYRLSLLTNNVREWEPHWRAMLPVDELFEDVVDSAFVGLRKPDPAIYELTCERLGVPPAECVLVDDFEVNCEGARALGMEAVRFGTTEQAIAELEALLAERGAPPRPPA